MFHITAVFLRAVDIHTKYDSPLISSLDFAQNDLIKIELCSVYKIVDLLLLKWFLCRYNTH